MYGLAVEHTEEDLLVWSGNGGQIIFYQSELPYGVNQEEYSQSFAGYRVSENVTSHKGYGIGVYCYFRDHEVTVRSGIVCPRALEEFFTHPLSVFLNGHGGITHILNDKGNSSTVAQPFAHWLC